MMGMLKLCGTKGLYDETLPPWSSASMNHRRSRWPARGRGAGETDEMDPDRRLAPGSIDMGARRSCQELRRTSRSIQRRPAWVRTNRTAPSIAC